MYCEKCGQGLVENAKFCPKCGNKVSEITIKITEKPTEVNNIRPGERIKCINCGYIGRGQKGRSTWASVLALLCILFAPIIPIIYFLATHKWLCPKCKSNFVGEINKEGKVIRGRNVLLIIVLVVLGIAILGILSSVVLVSLSGARSRARDARIIANMSQARAIAELINSEYGSHIKLCDLNNTLNQNAPTYGSQLAEIENDISAQQGGILNIVCYSSSGYAGIKYCVEAKTSTGFSCVDSTINLPVENTSPKCNSTTYNCSK